MQVIEGESGPLTTVEAVMQRVDTEDEDLLETLIEQATSEITSLSGREFAYQRVKETGLRERDGEIHLSLTPVREIHEVNRSGEWEPDFDIDDADAGIITRARPRGRSASYLWWDEPYVPVYSNTERYSVEYTGGYHLPGEGDRDLPRDLESICIEMVKAAYESISGNERVESKQVDQLRIKYRDSMAGVPGVERRLARYRRVTV